MKLNDSSKIDCKGKAEGKNRRRQECDIFLMYLIFVKWQNA